MHHIQWHGRTRKSVRRLRGGKLPVTQMPRWPSTPGMGTGFMSFATRKGSAGQHCRRIPESCSNQRRRVDTVACGPRSTRSRSFKAMPVNSSQEEGEQSSVWLRVRILKSLVFSLRTTVRAIRGSVRDADQSFSARRRIIGSVSANRTSRSYVSSTDTSF